MLRGGRLRRQFASNNALNSKAEKKNRTKTNERVLRFWRGLQMYATLKDPLSWVENILNPHSTAFCQV
jgi:hypothetical protein